MTQLECWIALPTAAVGTRVEIRWYWRSLTGGMSNIAYKIDNRSPFQYVHTPCDPCPSLQNNLTIDVSRLEIEHFGSDLEGDYVCRVLVINETSAVVMQLLQPSACTMVRLDEDLEGSSCSVENLRTSWQCASTEPSDGQCPQQLSSARPVTSTHTILLPSPTSYTKLLPSVPATHLNLIPPFQLLLPHPQVLILD